MKGPQQLLSISPRHILVTFPFLFDQQQYFETLSWLGKRIHLPEGSVVLRPLPLAMQDARGSWPYQSPPSIQMLRSLAEHGTAASLTTVIRPDIFPFWVKPTLPEVRKEFSAELRPLKAHLCHSASSVSAREGYSSRTRRRLNGASKLFSVQRENFGSCHMCIAEWQENVRNLRGIPHTSSPDAAHFAALTRSQPERFDALACITLRRRDGGALCGVFLAGQDGMNGSWHAHSALTDAAARADFGTYLLFDSVIEILNGQDIWFGGAPSGANGAGVFRFKQRFSNHSGTAHILSVDLVPGAVERLRTTLGRFSFLPDYRDPKRELLVERETG